MVGPSRVALRWLDRRQLLDRRTWLPGDWTIESGSPVDLPSRAATRWLDRRERLLCGSVVVSGSPVAGSPKAAPWRLDRGVGSPVVGLRSGSIN